MRFAIDVISLALALHSGRSGEWRVNVGRLEDGTGFLRRDHSLHIRSDRPEVGPCQNMRLTPLEAVGTLTLMISRPTNPTPSRA